MKQYSNLVTIQKVKPGLYHQFECIESGVAFELYWATFNHDDIVRETVGKMKKL